MSQELEADRILRTQVSVVLTPNARLTWIRGDTADEMAFFEEKILKMCFHHILIALYVYCP